MKVPFPS
ncbi:hypothetical protein D044_0637A, partial [Vibrio parahaemolyticus EKP-026]